MHRSRIGVLLIDLPEQLYAEGQDFWSGASGRAAIPEGDPYASLGNIGAVSFALQRIGGTTPPRLHLDIETDNVTAEVARLRALGATVDQQHEDYYVMRDPAGLIFCVVGIQTTDFDEYAVTWN